MDANQQPMPLGKMSEYGFEEDESGGLGGHQTDAGQSYITVIPVDYTNRRTYTDYDAFPRSATIARYRYDFYTCVELFVDDVHVNKRLSGSQRVVF